MAFSSRLGTFGRAGGTNYPTYQDITKSYQTSLQDWRNYQAQSAAKYQMGAQTIQDLMRYYEPEGEYTKYMLGKAQDVYRQTGAANLFSAIQSGMSSAPLTAGAKYATDKALSEQRNLAYKEATDIRTGLGANLAGLYTQQAGQLGQTYDPFLPSYLSSAVGYYGAQVQNYGNQLNYMANQAQTKAYAQKPMIVPYGNSVYQPNYIQ